MRALFARNETKKKTKQNSFSWMELIPKAKILPTTVASRNHIMRTWNGFEPMDQSQNCQDWTRRRNNCFGYRQRRHGAPCIEQVMKCEYPLKLETHVRSTSIGKRRQLCQYLQIQISAHFSKINSACFCLPYDALYIIDSRHQPMNAKFQRCSWPRVSVPWNDKIINRE